MSAQREHSAQKTTMFIDNILYTVLILVLGSAVLGSAVMRYMSNSVEVVAQLQAASSSEYFRGFVVYAMVDDGYEAWQLAEYYRERGRTERTQELAEYGLYLMRNDKDDPVTERLRELTK